MYKLNFTEWLESKEFFINEEAIDYAKDTGNNDGKKTRKYNMIQTCNAKVWIHYSLVMHIPEKLKSINLNHFLDKVKVKDKKNPNAIRLLNSIKDNFTKVLKSFYRSDKFEDLLLTDIFSDKNSLKKIKSRIANGDFKSSSEILVSLFSDQSTRKNAAVIISDLMKNTQSFEKLMNSMDKNHLLYVIKLLLINDDFHYYNFVKIIEMFDREIFSKNIIEDMKFFKKNLNLFSYSTKRKIQYFLKYCGQWRAFLDFADFPTNFYEQVSKNELNLIEFIRIYLIFLFDYIVCHSVPYNKIGEVFKDKLNHEDFREIEIEIWSYIRENLIEYRMDIMKQVVDTISCVKDKKLLLSKLEDDQSDY